MTKDEAFKARYNQALFGERFAYDTALPQTVLDDIKEKTGQYCTSFVYGYGQKGKEGFIPLTDSAEMLLNVYAYILGFKMDTFNENPFLYPHVSECI